MNLFKKTMLALVATFLVAVGSVSAQTYTNTANDTLTDAHTTVRVPLGNNVGSCTATIQTGAALGGGTIAAFTTNDGWTTAAPVSGASDLGNPSPVLTMNAVGTMTFPVPAAKGFELVISGSSGASVPVSVNCDTPTIARISGGRYSTPAVIASLINVTDPKYGARCQGLNTFDDGPGIRAAEAAVEATIGSFLVFPTGANCYSTPLTLAGNNTRWVVDGGPGYLGGASQFPNPVAGSATIHCFANTSSPLVTVFPSAVSTQAAGNSIQGMSFDSNQKTCPTAVYVKGNKNFNMEHVSASHFSVAAFVMEGGYLGDGSSTGSVGHMTGKDWNCNQSGHTGGGTGGGQAFDDGYCFKLIGTNPAGDTYMASIDGISMQNYNHACFYIGRSDANYLSNLQCKSLGASTNTIGGLIDCGSQSNTIDGFLSDQELYASGTDTVGTIGNETVNGCNFIGGTNVAPASGNTFRRVFQSDGSGPAPVFDVGSNGVWTDDNGFIHYVYGAGSTQPFPYIGWGPQFNSTSISPATTTPVVTSDNSNILLGVSATQGQGASKVYFGTSGFSGIKPGFFWDSYIASLADAAGGGALQFQGSTYYGPTGAVIGGGSFTNPTPTCVNAGALAATTYYSKVVGFTNTGHTLPAAEKTTSCLVNQVLKIGSPKNPQGIINFNFYVTNTAGGGSGTEQLQTTGTNVPTGTDWTEPTSGLAGTGAVPITDTSSEGLTATSISDAGILTGNCVQTTTNGKFVGSGSACATAAPAPAVPQFLAVANTTLSATPNTFSTLGTLTGTTPATVPTGTTQFLVELTVDAGQVATATSANSYLCAQLSASGSTVKANTAWNNTLTCKTSPGSGVIAGSPAFGNSANGGGQGLNGRLHVYVYIPVNTAYTFTVTAANDGSGAPTIVTDAALEFRAVP